MKVISKLLALVFLGVGLLGAPVAYAAGEEPALDAEPVVNINQADAAELAEALTGVGDKKAQAIVRYREANGDFASSSALTSVKGIGKVTVSKNEDRIRLE